ncbi:hypothetical protein ACM42_02450 [Bradyrhizobium sp. CCBAU 25338]|nr:hypothetical protein [Bradyrhizobium sp. CCBAU 45389]MDA9527312.1 hypothetical protein [Bradyrhizobium sp. CCBAU 25338]RXH24303.1 hypothetical protein XH84_33020 [Bradyrhizobium nanningense]
MLTLSAATLEGMRAKAVVLSKSVWNGDDAREQLGDATDAKFIDSLLADLAGKEVVLDSARPGSRHRPPHQKGAFGYAVRLRRSERATQSERLACSP